MATAHDAAERCMICRAIGFVLAAIVVGLVTWWLLGKVAAWVAVLAFLGLLALGLWLVTRFCGDPGTVSATHGTTAAAAALGTGAAIAGASGSTASGARTAEGTGSGSGAGTGGGNGSASGTAGAGAGAAGHLRSAQCDWYQCLPGRNSENGSVPVSTHEIAKNETPAKSTARPACATSGDSPAPMATRKGTALPR